LRRRNVPVCSRKREPGRASDGLTDDIATG
jgi:hypothetical protein